MAQTERQGVRIAGKLPWLRTVSELLDKHWNVEEDRALRIQVPKKLYDELAYIVGAGADEMRYRSCRLVRNEYCSSAYVEREK